MIDEILSLKQKQAKLLGFESYADVSLASKMHSSVHLKSKLYLDEVRRYNYVTPKNYLDFISNYRGCLKDERRKIDQLITRLDGGLSKLVQAGDEVAVGAAGSAWHGTACTHARVHKQMNEKKNSQTHRQPNKKTGQNKQTKTD